MRSERVGTAAKVLLALAGLWYSALAVQAGETFMASRAAGFSTVAPLNVARSQHTATLLSDGRVLVAGGEMDGGSTLFSSEIYDPVQNTWTVAASLNIARKRHTATLLSNGTVLVTGGLSDAGTVSSAEVFDPGANTWSNTSSMSIARQSHTATVLPNGKVLVAGGAKQANGSAGATVAAINSSEIFDPSSNGWTPAPNMAKAHFFHTAILLPNNKVLIASGALTQSPNFTTNPFAELYDYTTNAWTPGGMLATGRSQAVLAQITFGRILVAGGVNGTNRLASAELYDSQANSWSGTGALIVGRSLHTATVLSSGQVLVIAGFNGTDALNSAELFDPSPATWSSAGTLNSARQFHAATLLQNGSVLVTGGINTINLSSVELYSLGAASGPLALSSSPTASPNPATIGQLVTFSASASGGTGTLTYAWTFGDGASGAGASVTHSYSAAGNYGAAVTVTDSSAAKVSGGVVETVAGTVPVVAVGVGADNDHDGFSNAAELTFGSDPNNPNSLPLGVTNVASPLPLEVPRLSTRLVFNRGNHDSINVVGLLPIPNGFAAAGTKIGVDINGVAYLAILNAQGNSDSVFRLLLKKTNGAVQQQLAFFIVRLNSGTYSPAFATAGLTNGDFRMKKVSLRVSILFNGQLYQTLKPQLYNARLGIHGSSH